MLVGNDFISPPFLDFFSNLVSILRKLNLYKSSNTVLSSKTSREDKNVHVGLLHTRYVASVTEEFNFKFILF